MKNGIIACFVLFILSCNNRMEPPEPMHYPITLSYDHMPFDAFTQYSKATFISDNGEERIFDLEITESIHQVGQSLDDTTNKIELRYNQINDFFSFPFMTIQTGHYFNENQEIDEYITCFSSEFIGFTNHPSNFHFNPKLENQKDLEFSANVEILDKGFDNVYMNLESELGNINTFYYTEEFGIVGFLTTSGQTFVFENFEE